MGATLVIVALKGWMPDGGRQLTLQLLPVPNCHPSQPIGTCSPVKPIASRAFAALVPGIDFAACQAVVVSD